MEIKKSGIPRLKNPDQCRKFISRLIARLENNEIDISKSAEIRKCVSLITTQIHQIEINEQLAELEQEAQK